MPPAPQISDRVSLLRPAHILICDDEEGPRLAIEFLLNRQFTGVKITTVADGDATWKAIQHQCPDLLITDLCHPGMSLNHLLLRLVRSSRHVPTIVISAAIGAAETRRKLRSYPLPVFLLDKPWDASLLFALVRLALQETQ